MNLDFVKIENAGELAQERVVCRATVDVDVGDFAFFRGIATTGGKFGAGNVPSAYWFPNKDVKAGDWVVLYSKIGTSSEKKGEQRTSHFFYWGKSSPLWVSGAIASLVEITHWSFSDAVK